MIKGTCKKLIDLLEKVDEVHHDKNAIQSLFQKASVEIVRLKAANRSVHRNVIEIRKDVDVQKDKVDKAHLRLENLLYIQAHLMREIKSCKDLITPELQDIEKEIGQDLVIENYSSDLPKLHQVTLSKLNEELAMRKETQLALEGLRALNKQTEDHLEKKRKFLDDLPARISTVLTATSELQLQFGVELTQTEDVSKVSRLLCSPLYTLYHALNNVIEAADPSSPFSMALSITDIPILTSNSSSSNLNANGLQNNHSAKKSKGAAALDTNMRTEKCVDLTLRMDHVILPGEKDPLPMPPASVTLRFCSFSPYHVVYVNVITLALPKSCPFQPSDFLVYLFRNVDGLNTGLTTLTYDATPDMISAGKISSVGNNTIANTMGTSEVKSVHGTAYLWAQEICGIAGVSKGPACPQSSLIAVMQRLRSRLVSWWRLSRLLQFAEQKRVLPTTTSLQAALQTVLALNGCSNSSSTVALATQASTILSFQRTNLRPQDVAATYHHINNNNALTTSITANVSSIPVNLLSSSSSSSSSSMEVDGGTTSQSLEVMNSHNNMIIEKKDVNDVAVIEMKESNNTTMTTSTTLLVSQSSISNNNELSIISEEKEKAGCVYFKVVIATFPTVYESENVTALVEVSPEYPVRPTQVLLVSSPQIIPDNIVQYELRLKAIEAEVNAGFLGLLEGITTSEETEAAMDGSFSFQLSLLQSLLAVPVNEFEQRNESGSLKRRERNRRATTLSGLYGMSIIS